MNGNYSSSPKKESTTGRPDRDPLAAQDNPAKFLTQDRIISMPDQLLSVALHGAAVSLRNRTPATPSYRVRELAYAISDLDRSSWPIEAWLPIP